MKHLESKVAVWAAVAALGAVGLFAAQTSSPARGRGHGHMSAFLSSYLNLTDAQKAQAKSIFQDARQSEQPVRQQLIETRQSLRAAVQSGDNARINQLSASEGTEIGQLTAIRSSAMAKVYQLLTPDQQQKFAQLEQARKAARQAGQPAQN